MSLVPADELWLRLAWVVRLRWLMPPALVLLGVAVNAWMGPTVPLLATSALLALVWITNGAFVALLRSWRGEVDRRGRELTMLAHAQVLADVAIMSGAMYVTGGGRSPFWPFCCLTLLGAGLFFSRAAHVAAYGAATLIGFAAASWARGGLQPSLLLLTILVGAVGLIAAYFGQRVNQLLRVRDEARNKDQMLSVVSHELGNPLASLKASLYVEKQRGRDDVALRRIDSAVERMARIVGDLYDLSSLQTGQLRLERGSADLVSVVGEVVDRFRALHPTMSIEVDGPTAVWGAFDVQRLDQLLTNLLQNAAKYAGTSAKVRVAVYPASGGTVHLSVRDDGPGIPAARLPSIFEPFHRADRTGQRGLGLGLAVARQIAVLHGGALWAESCEGAGTTFHVRLPSGGVAPS